MSILSGPEIVRIVNRTREFRKAGHDAPVPAIDITPFNPDHAGPNSYDLTLGATLLAYDTRMGDQFIHDRYNHPSRVLDSRRSNPTVEHKIGPEGFILLPGVLYLGATAERTASLGVVPWLEGRSSIGRLGVCIHATAGFGDDGFGWPHGATWTLEITVVEPVRIYAGMRLCQIIFSTLVGERSPYKGKYQGQTLPMGSKIHEDYEIAPNDK